MTTSLIVKNSRDNKLYTVKTIGPWRGLIPFNVPEIDKANNQWVGKKIPIELWRQILAFFEWSFVTHNSESLVDLYYHDDVGWLALVLPQKCVGMTVERLPEHQNFKPTLDKLREIVPDWGSRLTDDGRVIGDRMGTVHHHCRASAFQSGTDHHDEKTQEGIHITVGNLNDPKYTIHSRCNYGNNLTDANLLDWFELDLGQQVNQLSPDILNDLKTKVIEAILVKKASPTDKFPDWWKDNIVKHVYANSNLNSSNYFNGVHGHNSNHSSNIKTHNVSSHNFNNDKRGGRSTLYSRGYVFFEEGIEKYCKKYSMRLVDVIAMLELWEAGETDLIDLLSDDNISVIEALAQLKRMKERDEKILQAKEQHTGSVIVNSIMNNDSTTVSSHPDAKPPETNSSPKQIGFQGMMNGGVGANSGATGHPAQDEGYWDGMYG